MVHESVLVTVTSSVVGWIQQRVGGARHEGEEFGEGVCVAVAWHHVGAYAVALLDVGVYVK